MIETKHKARTNHYKKCVKCKESKPVGGFLKDSDECRACDRRPYPPGCYVPPKTVEEIFLGRTTVDEYPHDLEDWIINTLKTSKPMGCKDLGKLYAIKINDKTDRSYVISKALIKLRDQGILERLSRGKYRVI